MATDSLNENQSLRGQPIIEEAARLLRQLQFSPHRGAYAEGQHVAVSVDPRWNAGNEMVRVLISCYAFGHRSVDWARLPVHALPADSSVGVHAIARLNARGQAVIPSLPLGEYRLALRLKPARVEPVFSQPSERLAAQDEDEVEERRVWRGEGEEGALVWTLEETEDGEVQVAFETTTERLAGHVVEFHLIDPDSKQVRYSHQLRLEPTQTPGIWEGWGSLGSRADIEGPFELIFELMPQDEDS